MASTDQLAAALRSSLTEIKRLRAHERDMTEVMHEPIAVIGMGCRLPGGIDTPDALWELLTTKRDAIGAFPTDRGWDPDRGFCDTESQQQPQGGFLTDASGFDAAFFGVSPNEATAMDPQHRVMLEISWQALEDAMIIPAALKHTATGVFTGIYSTGYALGDHPVSPETARHLPTGGITSAASGRLSYLLGLTGPALSVDTACSASLTAIHLACQSLRAGESELALAGGVTIVYDLSSLRGFALQQAIAPDGRCKPFSANANGMGVAEGAGVVVLERLSRARESGRRILAVIRGSAVNQDGASNGLTAPNGRSQQEVINAALADAGLSPADIDAVEAHGTGTPLGDPIEANALHTIYGQHRPVTDGQPTPLYIGSIKSNIGHTQAAAGVVGVIKTILALQNELLPATLHADPPSPHLPTSDSLQLLTSARPWASAPTRPRRAGISSFGISGTNAHLILEQPPPQDIDHTTPSLACPLWLLSAKTPATLREAATRLSHHLTDHPDLAPSAVARALATTRTHHPHRAAITLPTESRSELLDALDALADARPHSCVTAGAIAKRGKTAFVLPGQGSQCHGMGQRLAETFPVFRGHLEKVCAEFDSYLDRPLGNVMSAPPDSGQAALLDQTNYTQPALFAFQTALYHLLTSWGIRPDVLIGHSLGEITAAHLAGVLSLADAARLVATRASLMQAARSDGAMAAIEVTEDEMAPLLKSCADRCSVAAVNASRHLVISGDRDAVDDIARYWAARERRITYLRTSHAYHSHHMDSVVEPLHETAKTLTPSAPTIAVISNLTGQRLPHDQVAAPVYWADHVRRPVRFQRGIQTLRELDVTTFVELSPRPALGPAIDSTTCDQPDSTTAEVVISTAAKEDDGPQALTAALANLYLHGLPIDWARVFTGTGPAIALPTYPFQHQHFWLSSASKAARDTGQAPPPTEPTHVDRLNALNPGDQTDLLVEIIRNNLAALLGHTDTNDASADQPFAELGLDSVGAASLRQRVSTATGVLITPAALIDHPTAHDLALHVCGLFSSNDAKATPTGAFVRLVRHALSQEKAQQAIDLLTRAGALLPTYTTPHRRHRSTPLILTTGPDRGEAVLLCLPSLIASNNPFHYSRLAAQFDHAHTVQVLPHPDCAEPREFPDTIDTYADTQADFITELAADTPTVLIGHSSGGWCAHAVASSLIARGTAPTALVLLDTPPPNMLSPSQTAAILGQVIDPQPDDPAPDDDELIRTGAYLNLFTHFEGSPLPIPTLLIHATRPLSTTAGSPEPLPSWPHGDTVRTVDADHFSILREHASATAQTIIEWLRTQAAQDKD